MPHSSKKTSDNKKDPREEVALPGAAVNKSLYVIFFADFLLSALTVHYKMKLHSTQLD